MKRVFAALLLAVMAFGLCACDDGWNPSSYWDLLEEEETAPSWEDAREDSYSGQMGAMEATEAIVEITEPIELPTAVTARKPATQLEYWIDNCDTAYLSEADLYGMNKQDCRIARNAIYAKSGRIFNSQELTDYFNNFDWYKPTVKPDSFKESMLNQIQRHNLEVVSGYERKCGYQ